MKRTEEKMIPTEFEKAFHTVSADAIVYTGEGNKRILLIIVAVMMVPIITSLGLPRSMLLKFYCGTLVVPLIGLTAFFLFPKIEIEFSQKLKEITIYWKGIVSKNKVFQWNDIVLDTGHIPGRITTLKIDVINKVTNEIAVSMAMGRDEKRLYACINFLNDYMAGNPLKEHYYIEKKKDEHFFDQD